MNEIFARTMDLSSGGAYNYVREDHRKELVCPVNNKEEFKVINKVQIRVRYEETDRMGFVYYGNYFTWFEVGRTELFRSLGLPYKIFEERGIMLPVTEAESRYKRPAGYDDLLLLETSVSRLSGARIQFEYRLLAQNGSVIALGSTGHAFVDGSGRPVNLSKRDPELWKMVSNLRDK